MEQEILPACRELGIGFMAYAPLGRGFLTAHDEDARRAAAQGPAARASALQRGQHREERRACSRRSRKSPRRSKRTPAQVALAWLLAQGEDIVPIPGTKRRSYLEQNCAAADIALDDRRDRPRSTKAFPPNVTAGTRYPEKQLAGLGI